METVLRQVSLSAGDALHRLQAVRRRAAPGGSKTDVSGVRMSLAIPDEADRVLTIWGRYKRAEGGAVTLGYPRHSAGFISGGLSTDESFTEMVERADRRTGAISDAILDQMSRDGSHARHVLAIWNRYLGHVARFRGDPGELLVEGCCVFLIEARKRGIAV